MAHFGRLVGFTMGSERELVLLSFLNHLLNVVQALLFINYKLGHKGKLKQFVFNLVALQQADQVPGSFSL